MADVLMLRPSVGSLNYLKVNSHEVGGFALSLSAGRVGFCTAGPLIKHFLLLLIEVRVFPEMHKRER